jgi:hypothetical protein
MNKLKRLILGAMIFCPAMVFAQINPAPAGSNDGNSYSGYLVNTPGQAFSKTFPIDLSVYDASKVSVQVIYGTAAFASSTFTDGAQSSGTITISSYSALVGQTLNINGTVFTGGASASGTTFAAATSNAATATSLAAAINATFTTIVSSNGATTSVVHTTSTINGAAYNYSIVSSTPAAMTVLAGGMTGGITPVFALGGSNIQITGNGYTLGLPLLYTKNSATIGGLTDQTTYYAIPVGSNFIQLATTSAQAVLSVPVIFTSTTTQLVAHAPAFSVPVIAGSPTFIWQSSNDNLNWGTAPSTGTVTVNISSAVPTNLLYDLGVYDYRYLRLNFTGPTQGAVNLAVPVNIKQDGIGRF